MKTKLRILMIEDSPEDAVLITHELEHADYDVICERVETEPALRRALDELRWDAVLCDYTMPQFGGEAALHIVKEVAADLPFIYVSGTIGEDVAVEAMKSGAHDYVMKSNLKRLAPAVNRELREAELRRERRLIERDRDQLIEELEAALNEIKTLTGLLPICMRCKRIRDEDDSWLPIEDYVQAHTEARFSHGLCPECLAHYGEVPGAEDRLGEAL